MKQHSNIKTHINISFEEIKLPPFEDILVIAKNSSFGKIGVVNSLEMLEPEKFTAIDIDDEIVELVLINKKLINKIPSAKIIELLRKYVFPYITHDEIIKVDFKIKIIHDTLEI